MGTGNLARPFVILCILTVLVLPSPGQAEEWSRGRLETAVYAGLFDTAADSPSSEVGIELRRAASLENLSLLAGIAGNGDGGAWVYGGARYDLALGARSRWTLAPGFAVSLYEQGDGKDLGHVVEFRSSIEIARRFSERFRLGFVFYHLSNSSISETNPGSNSAVLNFAFRRPRVAAE